MNGPSPTLGAALKAAVASGDCERKMCAGSDELRRKAVRKIRSHRRSPRVPEMEDDGMTPDRVGVVDKVIAFVRAHRISGIRDGAQREENVLRANRHSVAPTDAAPKLVAYRPAVGREPAVLRRRDPLEKRRYRAPARVEVDERLEGKPGNLLLDRSCVRIRKERIEVARVGRQVEAHLARRRRAAWTGAARRPGEQACQ